MSEPTDWTAVADEVLGVMKAAADVAVKRAADEIYARILEGAQDYLEDNLRFNIGCTLDAAERERKAAQDRVAGLLATNADLLATLTRNRAALDLIDPMRPLQYATTMDLMRKDMEAAIAKAEGRSDA